MPGREPEFYKDKIEVSLDGRQIFYLFFGGAVIVGMVFVLGVMVGRRVEARGHLDRADPQAAGDPLAALDRLDRPDKLSFHGALTGSETTTEVEKAIGELEKRRAAGRTGADASPPRAEAKAEPKPDARPEGKADAKAEVKTEAKSDAKADAKPDAKADAKPDARVDSARAEPVTHPDGDKPRSDKRDADKRDADKADKKPHKHDDSAPGGAKPDHDKKAHGDARAAADAADGKPDARSDAKPDAKSDKVRFTLQLSSFQDRAEAEAFLGTVKSSGFQPYLTEADVTGKGTFYRVRLGSYRSLDAANDAKTEYEKASRKAAQVMRL